MDYYLVKIGKCVLKKIWVQAFLIGVILSVVAVSVFYSEDRWTALGVVGTWVIGVFAAFISYSQYNEQKQRKESLMRKNELSIQFDCIRVSAHLIEIVDFFYTKIKSKKLSFNDVNILRELVKRSVLWPRVNLELLNSELVESEKIQEILHLNTWLEALVGRFEFYLKTDDLTIFSRKAFFELISHIERIQESVNILSKNYSDNNKINEKIKLAKKVYY